MKTKSQTTIFSTGVHLQSVECVINRKKQWRWIAVGFEDESFLNGKDINPIEYAKKPENLVEKFQNETQL
ncbi:hypothetical protein COT20_02110 [bacterium (Candidatus Gribaldobacteria) CG08_land_8_20_14_0_20_39_15]|uniref:Uncharacterized protein n=1 Tax=bacterium (Candidatus Gribaldobacteria) CG08_land_8_20_14_0_20_39_15 TaxID=2014273 RepID=A0A2M6XU79_9BACT|nr:MAG: hypothetical protein COT20_02110 [bacterium (Candidatus Gribaldobacteria) CG08_land_8_20_14_0_20_39_15]